MSIAATRYAHTEGRVGLAYGKDGEKVRKLREHVKIEETRSFVAYDSYKAIQPPKIIMEVKQLQIKKIMTESTQLPTHFSNTIYVGLI